MRRPRGSSAEPAREGTWNERTPPSAAEGRSWRPAFASSRGGPHWLSGMRASGGIPNSNEETVSQGVLQPGRRLILRVIFWPLTLSLMLTGTLYRFLLRVGTSSSPLAVREPSRWLVQAMSWPFRLVNPPVVLGADNLRHGLARPEGLSTGTVQPRRGDGKEPAAGMGDNVPILLVGNHTLLGLDCVPMLDEIQDCTGVLPRVLYDTLFGYIPGWRQVAEAAGGSMGTLGNCDALMSEGRCVMLYPGGAKEALKRTGADNYKLMWNEKLGFVRMAVKHGYSVLPFASVGLEDAVSVAFTMDITWIVRRIDGNCRRLRVPFLYPFNSLQRQYFAFGEQIDTSHFGGDWENFDKCYHVYNCTKKEVERLIQHLKHVQELDPDRFVLRRTWRFCRKLLGGLKGQSWAVSLPGLKPR